MDVTAKNLNSKPSTEMFNLTEQTIIGHSDLV